MNPTSFTEQQSHCWPTQSLMLDHLCTAAERQDAGPWWVYYAAVLRVTLATMQKDKRISPTRINEELHFIIISLSLPLNRHETLKSSQLFLHTAGMTHAQIQRDECLTFCSALICFVRKLKHIKHQTFGSWCSCSHWIIGALTLNNFSKYFILSSQIFGIKRS